MNYRLTGKYVSDYSDAAGMLLLDVQNKRWSSEMLDLCDEALVTYIDYSYQADTYFPNLDKRPEWVLASESEEQTHFDIVYYYRTYVRRKDFIG